MPVDAKTIQIFLPTGEPRGLRTAEITTRTVQAIAVPRARLDQFFGRRESEQVGLYFLFGQRDDEVKPIVYIGQTEDLKGRMRHHNNNRDFWSTAVVVISRTQSFTQAHIRYLEWHSIAMALEAGRFIVENGNDGSRPFVPEPMEADVLDAFETMEVLVAILGFPVFEPPAGNVDSRQQRDVFICRGPLADGRGMLVDDGFVILAGSLTGAEPVPSAENFRPWFEELRNAGVLQPINEEQCRVTQDYVVNSPSYAASLVLARKANGWEEWRREDGTTLSEVYRTDEAQEPSSRN
jgi:hypothetical protein